MVSVFGDQVHVDLFAAQFKFPANVNWVKKWQLFQVMAVKKSVHLKNS
jgi:hypothetical protein